MAGRFASALLLALAATAAGVNDTETETETTTSVTPLPLEWMCEAGCWSTENEECFGGNLNYNQCMQIYGHREWKEEACNCGYREAGSLPSAPVGTVNVYFSVPAFVVLFRESLEVVLVLVIILQFLQKSKEQGAISADQHKAFSREVYVGASFGFLACIGIGFGFLALLAFALKGVEGDAHLAMEGALMIFTSFILSFMALNFYKMMYAKEAHERKMKKRMEEALSVVQLGDQLGSFSKKHTFLLFAFMTGLREGLESILFLSAVVVDAKDLTALPIPIISAIILARIFGWCFWKGTSPMRVEIFMKCSAVLLLFIAAGFFTSSMHNFQELDLFGTWSPKRLRPWQNQEVFNASECCNDMTNRFFVFMRAMFGWQDRPTPIEFFAYALYWIASVITGYFMIRRAKAQLEQMKEKWREEDRKREAEENGTADMNASAVENAVPNEGI